MKSDGQGLPILLKARLLWTWWMYHQESLGKAHKWACFTMSVIRYKSWGKHLTLTAAFSCSISLSFLSSCCLRFLQITLCSSGPGCALWARPSTSACTFRSSSKTRRCALHASDDKEVIAWHSDQTDCLSFQAAAASLTWTSAPIHAQVRWVPSSKYDQKASKMSVSPHLLPSVHEIVSWTQMSGSLMKIASIPKGSMITQYFSDKYKMLWVSSPGDLNFSAVCKATL